MRNHPIEMTPLALAPMCALLMARPWPAPADGLPLSVEERSCSGHRRKTDFDNNPNGFISPSKYADQSPKAFARAIDPHSSSNCHSIASPYRQNAGVSAVRILGMRSLPPLSH